jgi:hypothetical protein
MTTTAQSIVLRAQVVLQDETGTRWSANELVRHLNDGQREIARLRPDSTATTLTHTLTTGFKQDLPSTSQALIDIHSNVSGTKRRITKVDMVQLDAVSPDWRNQAGGTEIRHFMHDLREPRVFYVYPPVSSGVQVEMAVSAYPTDVGTPTAPGLLATTVTGNISVQDHWAETLLNFVLFKAYSKDAEYGGNANLAAGYLSLFNTAMGTQLQSTSTVAPKE